MADEDEPTVDASAKQQKLRSPNYPATDLKDAIERIKKIYDGIRTGSATDEVVVVAMGYRGLNGASRTMLSALRKFGLLEDAGRNGGNRISEDAKAVVLLPATDPTYIEAVRRCALRPPVFAELHKTYGEALPSEATLKFMLVKKGFVEEAAQDLIKNYRRTMAFVQTLGGNLVTETPSKSSDDEEESSPLTVGTPSPKVGVEKQPEHARPSAIYNPTAELSLTLPGGCKAHVLFEGNVTKEAVDRLRVYLEFFAEDQPTIIQSQRAYTTDANGE